MDLQIFENVLRNNQHIGFMEQSAKFFSSFKNIFGSAEMFDTSLFFGNVFTTFL